MGMSRIKKIKANDFSGFLLSRMMVRIMKLIKT
jgi:hypothetical protein